MSPKADQGMILNIVRADRDGVTIIIDGTEVYDGGEQIIHRTRVIAEKPVEAMECVATALWPHRNFMIFEKDDKVPQ